MVVKNISASNVAINKSVQIDVDTIDANDGYVLPNQTLDLSLSLSPLEILASQDLKQAVYDGNIIFVVDGDELSTATCIEIYKSGYSRYFISQL